ncbi:hypothetical protein [Anaerobacillus alkalidiazotrophicus]|nr:hypothetical protein [Anaerobacillus alkalidiazotrophicus]
MSLYEYIEKINSMLEDAKDETEEIEDMNAYLEELRSLFSE